MDNSLLHNVIYDFLEYRKMTGFNIKIYKRHLKQFENYCTENNISLSEVTKEILEKWCNYKEESEQTKRKRFIMMQKFASYLKIKGFKIDIPSSNIVIKYKTTIVPYIFSESELKRFFCEVDNSDKAKTDSLLFRLYYGCGLRMHEALSLKCCDVNLIDGIITIRNAKNGRTRMIPLSSCLWSRCKQYAHENLINCNEDDYFFFIKDPRKPLSDSTVYWRFRAYLKKAGIPHLKQGPRVHDFRHTMCVHRLKTWVLEGKDLNAYLPYLSKYMGHVDFRGTEYYLKLTADLYPYLIEKMNEHQMGIIPVREDN